MSAPNFQRRISEAEARLAAAKMELEKLTAKYAEQKKKDNNKACFAITDCVITVLKESGFDIEPREIDRKKLLGFLKDLEKDKLLSMALGLETDSAEETAESEINSEDYEIYGDDERTGGADFTAV